MVVIVMTVHMTQQEVEGWKHFNEKIPKKRDKNRCRMYSFSISV